MSEPTPLYRLTTSFLELLQKQHRQLKGIFDQELVIGGKVVPRGSILLIPKKYKDALINLYGHVVPLGEIKRLPGGIEVKFTDRIDGDQMIVIPNTEINPW